jgi:hypothetical protein
VQFLRYVLAAPFLVAGAGGIALGILTLWFEPRRWDWFASLFGGNFGAWLFFMAGTLIFMLGASIAGKLDDWL